MKKILTLVFGLILVFFLVGFASAQSSNAQIPEKNGDYSDPEHPGIHVRVFVHEPKDTRGSNGSTITCSADNNTGTPTDAITPWRLPQGVWVYNLNVSSTPSSVGGTNLPTIAEKAFSQWQGAQTKVAFTRGLDTSMNRNAYDLKNIVAWGHTSGSALAVTYTRYNQSTGMVVDVDTIFNSKFPWTWSDTICNPNAYDARDILTHETGHWMGLDDNYAPSYSDNTMYGYGSKGEIKKDTLTTGDTQSIQAIY